MLCDKSVMQFDNQWKVLLAESAEIMYLNSSLPLDSTSNNDSYCTLYVQ